MQKRLQHIIQISRVKEYGFFALAYSLLGVVAADGFFGVTFIVLLIANLLCIGFTFITNDIADAPFDFFDGIEAQRNPVVKGVLSLKHARLLSLAVAVIALTLQASINWRVFLLGVASILVGWLYSDKSLRRNSLSLLDRSAHSWHLAGLLTLSGFFAFAEHFSGSLLYPFLFVVFLNLYGTLSHTAPARSSPSRAPENNSRPEARFSHLTLFSLLFLALFSGSIAFIIQRIVPLWVVALMAILSSILIFPPLLKVWRDPAQSEARPSFHRPLEKAAAITLLVYYLAPILTNLF